MRSNWSLMAFIPTFDMKTRLSRISPVGLGLYLGFIGFVISIPVVIFAFAAIAPGRTVNLTGFFSLTFTNELDTGLVLIYHFLNTLAGVISGIVAGFLYNLYARLFGGIPVNLTS